MKVKFSMREKLYADVEFEIECESKEQNAQESYAYISYSACRKRM